VGAGAAGWLGPPGLVTDMRKVAFIWPRALLGGRDRDRVRARDRVRDRARDRVRDRVRDGVRDGVRVRVRVRDRG